MRVMENASTTLAGQLLFLEYPANVQVALREGEHMLKHMSRHMTGHMRRGAGCAYCPFVVAKLLLKQDWGTLSRMPLLSL